MLLQGTIHIVLGLRGHEKFQSVTLRELLLRRFIVGDFDLIIKELGIARTTHLIISAVQHLIRTHKTITLTSGIIDIGLREITIETDEHLVDALSHGVEGERMDNVQVFSYLRHEKGGGIQSVARQFTTQITQHRIGIL